jgi:peroxiredoxin
MANPLTGTFDAVFQISVRQINGLLATLHQNGVSDDAALKLLHSVRTRIGDERRRPPDLGAFGDWVLEYQQAQDAGPRPPVQGQLVVASPPGIAGRLAAAFKNLNLVLEPAPPDVVRGLAAIQISTIRLSVADGSTSEITIHANVRAHYDADEGTTALPAPLNGEVRAVYEIRKVVQGTTTRLFIRPSSQDQKIEFIPAAGSGLTGADAAGISVQVRKMLRDGIQLLPIDLPAGFPFTDFRCLGGGATATIALPLQLSNNPPGPGGILSITQGFMGPTGFGFAVSREHVEGLIDIQRIKDKIRERRIRLSVSIFGQSVGVTYDLAFTSGPKLTFQTGAIEISGRVSVTTDNLLAPNGFVSFKQRVTLVLDVAAQRVDLVTLGEPNVDESFFIPHSVAVNTVKSEIASALANNAPAVQRVFRDARLSLETAVRNFERSVSAAYAQVQVSPDGIIIRGELSSAPRIAPVVKVGEADLRRAFSAFQSWIPGGQINRFTWSWVEYPSNSASIWSGVSKSVTEAHSFRLPKPTGLSEISQICLRIEGERILADGRTEVVTAGTVCDVGEPVVAFDAPSWWGPVMIPVWRPDLSEHATLRESIAAHISIQTDRPQQELMQNALVFFPDWQAAAPFEALARAIAITRGRHLALAVIAILPPGSFDRSRREIEARFGAFPREVAARVHVAEDTVGAWARTFDVTAPPSLFLINARRQFVWKAAGELDPAAIAAALDAHVVPASGPRFRPLRLHVSPGDRAPDVFFQDDRRDESALHRFRGRAAIFTFWQSWSAPCLEELKRLQTLQNGARETGPVIVAFHGGPALDSFDAIRKEYGLSFSIVQDEEHRVARKFGVRCWPTTFAIDPEGRIEHVQLGVAPAFGHVSAE